MIKNTFLDDFLLKKWKYLMIEGSKIGNSSFLLYFVNKTVLGDKTEASVLDRLIDENYSILYIRSDKFLDTDLATKKQIEQIKNRCTFEEVYSEEAFTYDNILRFLYNRRYTHLIVDDVRKKYDDSNKFNKFNEVLNYCEQNKIKVISSLTESRQKKLDYVYGRTEIIIRVSAQIIENIYKIEMEDKAGSKYKSYSIPMG